MRERIAFVFADSIEREREREEGMKSKMEKNMSGVEYLNCVVG